MTGKPRTKYANLGRCSLLGGLALIVSCPAAMADDPGRRWTPEDIVSVPKVISMALSYDGAELAYLERTVDIAGNRTLLVLYRLDLASGARAEVARAIAADKLEAIAGKRAWNVLLDLGDGQQLYQIDSGASARLVLASEAKVTVGQAEGNLFAVSSLAPHRVGVLAYDWSPDRRWLWYAALKPGPSDTRVQFDSEVTAQKHRRRAPVPAVVELRLRSSSGEDTLIATRPTSDRLAFYLGATVRWGEDGLRYFVETTSGIKSDESEAFDLKFASLVSTSAGTLPGLPSVDYLKGPHGGQLASEGTGASLDLIETGPDGTKHSYGRYGFYIGDPRSAASWRSEDGKRLVLGVRTTTHPRYGLAVVSKAGIRTILTGKSLSRCDFRADLSWGICVEESLSQPPRFVRVEPGSGRITKVLTLSARHEAIAPLKITAHQWKNRADHIATGFIVWPRDYIKGQPYPAILVTHGSDADERFADQDLQWDFPVQAWAERGYVVVLINDPSPRLNPDLMAGYAQWRSGKGHLSPAKVQDSAWIGVVHMLEDVVSQLVSDGLVDRSRVGIAGYSRGSQITNVAVTQSGLFRAASSGDGSFLEPSAWSQVTRSYTAIFGGPPAGDFLENYRRLSPSLRADHACAAVLQQMATPLAGAIDFHMSLRAARVPSQISLYPGETTATDETHLFHIPSNRLAAMRENLAWFDFWLRDVEQTDASSAGRAGHWIEMARSRRDNCPTFPAISSHAPP
ncbi:hypothetical protein B5J99_01535 [Blastomonas fulva]|uniref:Peptidase S9 prolyl oligopeptidase catalytic domain-containing protein n=2 Tax=Blastomonas fulva TaxID=1550728 RepID=A0ABM6M377_9SPHN|nr:hypothetical protein B5J99_01535 [Blastomonas fulva]